MPRGFHDLPCPLCGESNNISLDLGDVGHFACNECNNDFTQEDVQNFIDKWTPVLAWTATAPAVEE